MPEEADRHADRPGIGANDPAFTLIQNVRTPAMAMVGRDFTAESSRCRTHWASWSFLGDLAGGDGQIVVRESGLIPSDYLAIPQPPAGSTIPWRVAHDRAVLPFGSAGTIVGGGSGRKSEVVGQTPSRAGRGACQA